MLLPLSAQGFLWPTELVKVMYKEWKKQLQSSLEILYLLEEKQQNKEKSILECTGLYFPVFIQVHRGAFSRLQINTSGQILNKPQGTNKNLHAWKPRQSNGSAVTSSLWLAVEFTSSHFSTLSKSQSILHLSVTLTIWQAEACLFPCQFAKSCPLATHMVLACYLSQSSRKIMGEKQKMPLNVDDEKKYCRFQELKNLGTVREGTEGVVWASSEWGGQEGKGRNFPLFGKNFQQ